MNYSQILKNKFVIALPIGLLLLGCLHKFNQYKKINNNNPEDTNKEKEEKFNFTYYIKYFLVCYIIALVLTILLKRGYKYYIENIKSKSSQESNIIVGNNPSSLTINSDSKSEPLKIVNPIIKTNNSNNTSNNILKELDIIKLDTDTSELEEVALPKVDIQNEKLKKKKILLSKRKKLLELKKQKALQKEKNRQPNNQITNKNDLALEVFNTGTPNF